MANPGGIHLPIYRYYRYFVDQEDLQAQFSLGIVRDMPRADIPPGGVYSCTDFLVDQPGVLRQRGEAETWGKATSGSQLDSVFVAPFSANLIGTVNSSGVLYDVTNPAAVTTPGSIYTVKAPPSFINSNGTNMIVYVASGQAPKKVTPSAGTFAIASLGGTPPQGAVSCVHLSYLLIANTSGNPNRLYFSPIPNIESTWDTTNAYIDLPAAITGLASLSGVLLVWTQNGLYRIIGNVPPGTAGENMQLQPLAGVGAFDARSIAVSDNIAYFASYGGVYAATSTGVKSLTEKPNGSGIQSYWRSIPKSQCAMGIYNRDYLFVSLGNPTPVRSFICYLPTLSWTEMSWNFCNMYASYNVPPFSTLNSPELLGAHYNTGNVLTLGNCITNATLANGGDPSGVSFAPFGPSMESRMIGTGADLKTYGHAHITYKMTSGVGSPTLRIQVATGLEADSGYSAVPESPLAIANTVVRQRFTVNKDSQGLYYKLQQITPNAMAGVLEVYALSTDVRTLLNSDGQ